MTQIVLIMLASAGAWTISKEVWRRCRRHIGDGIHDTAWIIMHAESYANQYTEHALGDFWFPSEAACDAEIKRLYKEEGWGGAELLARGFTRI